VLSAAAWLAFLLPPGVLSSRPIPPLPTAATNSKCDESGNGLRFDDPSSASLRNIQAQVAREQFTRGLKLYSAGQLGAAEKAFKAAVNAKPGESEYVQEVARFYIDGEQYEQALGVIRDYVKLCGTTAVGYALEAELLFKQRQYDAAFLAIRDSLNLSPDSARMHELLGLVQIMKKQDAAASLELKKAAELDPHNAQIRYYYGRTLYSLGDYKEARNQFLACLGLEPHYRMASWNLALCYEALLDYPKASQNFLQAINLENAQKGPEQGEPFGFYGAMLFKLGKPEKALPILREGVTVSPQSFVANYELGRVLLSLGRLHEAEHYLLVAQKLAPDFPRLYYLLGKVYQKEHREKEAGEDLAQFNRLSKRGAETAETGYPLTDPVGVALRNDRVLVRLGSSRVQDCCFEAKPTP
jgi:tetratricopeptide (TPR) repeat protein